MDLILLDVNMPVMDGLTFLRALRRDSSTAETPVIMLSGAEDRQDVLQAAKLGIRGYVLKSHFSLKDFADARDRSILAVRCRRFAPIASQATRSRLVAVPLDVRTGPIHACFIARHDFFLRPPRCHDPGPSAQTGRDPIAHESRTMHRASNPGHFINGIALRRCGRSDFSPPRPRAASASDLTAMIARDPLLSARVLQVANSSAYASTRGAVSTLSEAVRNIGCAAVRNIAAALGVFNAMPISDSDGFSLLRCWQHAFAVATLANHLSTERDSGLAYLVGLCHNLGEILFHSQFAEEYRQVLEIQQSTGKPRDEVERIMLGMSQGEVIRTIVKCLDLPEAISAPIQEYHSKGPAGSGGSPLTRLLRVADLYANGMLLASSNQSPIRPLTSADMKTVTGNDNPPPIDRVAMRSEIVGLTAMLSRFPEKQQAEVMASPFLRQPIRIWLARDPSLSSFDPVAAALEMLAEVTPRVALPATSEAAEHQAIIVMARSTSATGFTSAELKRAAIRPSGGPLPILWLVGRVDGGSCDAVPSPWPVPLAKLADFVVAAGIP